MLVISWTTLGAGETDDADLTFTVTEHTLVFDAVLNETHEATSTLTEHSVENGSPISDHKRPNPRIISVEGLVTQTPLDSPPSSGDESRSITAEIQQAEEAGANVLVFDSEFDRLQDVFDQLEELRATDTELTVTTRLHVYDSIQLVRVQTPRQPNDGDSVRFQVDFREVNIVESRLVDAPESREPRGANTRDRGGQETEEGDSDRQQSRLSAIEEAVDDAGGIQELLGNLL